MAVERTLILAEPDGVARGSLRCSCALAMPNNLVRGSDSPVSAAHEIAVWFADVPV